MLSNLDWSDCVEAIIAGVALALLAAIWKSEKLRNLLRRLSRKFVSWTKRALARYGRWVLIILLAVPIEGTLYLLYSDWWILGLSILRLALIALAAWPLASKGSIARVTRGQPRNLQEVMLDATSAPLGTGPSRIFHARCPYILPICFRDPRGSQYIYIIVDTRVEDEDNEDQIGNIVTKPVLGRSEIQSLKVARGRWYQLTSDRPLESIRFADGPARDDFEVVQAQIYVVKAWNKHSPVIVPTDRQRAYGLAITEQKGSSTWFVSMDDQLFLFDENLGCHFVELVLAHRRQHTLAFGHKEGVWGIACAFFAF